MHMNEVFFLLVLIVVSIFSSRKVRRFAARLFFSSNSGKQGERKVARILKRAFRKTPHYIFNNILIEQGDLITQIDHLVISTKGIFIIETKDLKGWVFGSPRNKTWTQTIYRDKYKFPNPLRQNYKHQKMLETVLSINSRDIQAIVVFTDRSVIKTPMPDHVLYTSELRKYIRAFNSLSIEQSRVDRLAIELEQIKLPNSRKNLRKHKKHVREIRRSKARNF